MNIDDLKLFVEIARKGGFAAAARARNVDPSAISRAVAALESDIGVRLFHRSTRKVSLTEAGDKLLAHLSAALDDLDAACEEARAVVNSSAGTLRMTASNAFGPTCIAPVLPTFRQLYPHLKLELILNDDNL